MFQFVYTRCGKHCTNFGVLAKQMKIHMKRKVDSTPLLRFFKRAPAKKIAVIRKPIKKKPQQIKLREKSRAKPLRPSKITIISFAYPIRRSCLSSTKTYRRRILATLLRLKALFLFIWKNVHHNFEWFMSNIFENWMRKLVIKPFSITSKQFEICKNLKWKECDNTCMYHHLIIQYV